MQDNFLFEEIEEISVPVSDFSAGLATGIGFGLAILALAGFEVCSFTNIKLFQFHFRQSFEFSVLVLQQEINRISHYFIDCGLRD
ncbi:hypothetical protein CHL72_00030 [Streptococcus pneumoniae]|nr:hypothetical protein CHL72_00030 [Streptococcus pneumoniae]